MNLRSKDYKLVGLQMLLFILYVFDPNILSLAFPAIIRTGALIIAVLGGAVLILAMLQLSKNLSPFPSPKTNSELVQSGLYKYVRHPIYTGIVISSFSLALATASVFRILISILLYILFMVKSEYEEKLLMQRYKEYESYKKRTGRFFPKI
ncbi:methyltransferase family protein [Christiangramia sabulilitoris]|uniref:Isoprenylcysteine carboxylmethyltransferase family protein n=1 Tax=Christiangramia sabulilitoris TaxID=2583991 RepID=A0A550I3W3_9FLAO|nr:isoprenylcysteine carboxylmethyltransferase family protein [Christiangramia sabulilitoris]TRO65518.1 isoprenylcysteine carboxylmethyltransferase family protein [Christiangramia sabulilitoris]